MIIPPKTIYPRLVNNSTVLVKGITYKVEFWNVTRKYIFIPISSETRIDNLFGHKIKTEEEVATLLTKKVITVLG